MADWRMELEKAAGLDSTLCKVWNSPVAGRGTGLNRQ
jgi:hypothetical protein